MNILHITAQKPTSTGSGVYLTQLARAIGGISLSGCIRQGVMAGVYSEDIPEVESEMPAGIHLYPVVFETQTLPFHIFGISDVMPYRSSLYSSMTAEQLASFSQTFLEKADEAVADMRPDVILCHHLYLLTALIRRHFPNIPVYAFCHNTDLTQRRAHDLAAGLIDAQIPRLDGVFALHEEQKEQILSIFNIGPDRIHTVGAGYDPEIFYPPADRIDHSPVRLVFAGKLSRAKGVPTLLRALRILAVRAKHSSFDLTLAGSSGSVEEQREIETLAAACPFPVRFAGAVSQPELADICRRSDIFVLPSLNEGLPLSVIEALACGLKIVMTDLSGARGFIDSHLPDAPVIYVPLSDGINGDYDDRFAAALEEAALEPPSSVPDMSSLTWKALAERVIETVDADCSDIKPLT